MTALSVGVAYGGKAVAVPVLPAAVPLVIVVGLAGYGTYRLWRSHKYGY